MRTDNLFIRTSKTETCESRKGEVSLVSSSIVDSLGSGDDSVLIDCGRTTPDNCSYYSRLPSKLKDSLHELKETGILLYWGVREGAYFLSNLGKCKARR